MAKSPSKITVAFTRSIAKKINVTVIDTVMHFENINENLPLNAHYNPSGGAARVDLLVTISLTALVLTVIIWVLMLALR